MKTIMINTVKNESNRINKVMEANKETSKQISKEANKWGKITLPNHNLANRFKLNQN